MKIGIITLWQSSDNYGQQLQCWALQQILIALGHQPYLIRYDIEGRKCKRKSSLYRKLLKVILIYPLLKTYVRKKQRIKEKQLSEYNKKKNEKRNFETFRFNHLRMSETKYSNLFELQQSPPLADAYIVGSDQVWAHLLDIEENSAMFLNFGSSKTLRISYAPSFSMGEYPRKLKERLKQNLSRFNFVSVREQTGQNICREVGFDSTVVLDPTLLLSSDKYQEIKTEYEKTKYIYIYYLNISNAGEICWNKLNSFAKDNKMSVIATPASGYFQGRELIEGIKYEYSTIPQWIGLIDNASLVVTTSFHGVVFCLLHHTAFIYFPLKGKHCRGNNRVLDLCKTLGLTKRIWNSQSDFKSLLEENIDWQEVDNILSQQRKHSLEFLINALK